MIPAVDPAERFRNHKLLQKAINDPGEVVDYSVFKKSKEEKAIAKALAQNWKNARK